MDGFWPLLVTVAVLGMILGGYVWLASRMRRRGIGGSALGPFEEMWDPTAHRYHIEVEVQAQRKAPASSPDDPPWPGATGSRTGGGR